MAISARTTRKRDVKREVILDCAQRLLQAEGYDNFTMQDIADAADISKGSLYLHFKDKEELFVAVIGRSFDRLRALLQEEIQTGGTALDKLERIARVAWRFQEENPDLFKNLQLTYRVVSDSSAPGMCFVSDHFRRIQGVVESIFKEGSLDGSLRSGLDAATLIPLFSILVNAFLEKLAQINVRGTPFIKTTPKRLIDEFFAMIVRYVQAQPKSQGGARA